MRRPGHRVVTGTKERESLVDHSNQYPVLPMRGRSVSPAESADRGRPARGHLLWRRGVIKGNGLVCAVAQREPWVGGALSVSALLVGVIRADPCHINRGLGGVPFLLRWINRSPMSLHMSREGFLKRRPRRWRRFTRSTRRTRPSCALPETRDRSMELGGARCVPEMSSTMSWTPVTTLPVGRPRRRLDVELRSSEGRTCRYPLRRWSGSATPDPDQRQSVMLEAGQLRDKSSSPVPSWGAAARRRCTLRDRRLKSIARRSSARRTILVTNDCAPSSPLGLPTSEAVGRARARRPAGAVASRESMRPGLRTPWSGSRSGPGTFPGRTTSPTTPRKWLDEDHLRASRHVKVDRSSNSSAVRRSTPGGSPRRSRPRARPRSQSATSPRARSVRSRTPPRPSPRWARGPILLCHRPAGVARPLSPGRSPWPWF